LLLFAALTLVNKYAHVITYYVYHTISPVY